MTLARRRVLTSLLLVLLAAISAMGASLPQRWGAWKYLRDISSGQPGALHYIAIGPDVLQHSSPNISDLRILDDSGAETPYVLRTSVGVTKTESWPATIRENSFVPGKYTQLVLDLGTYPRFHNAVKLDTPESDFILWAEVDASDDARTWRIVKDRAPISRFRKERLEGNQTLRYSENNARYLRIQIRQAESQFPVTGAFVFPSSLSSKEIIPEQLIELQPSLGPDGTASADRTVWNLDLGRSIPISVFGFSTTQDDFYRGVRISSSVDAREWNIQGGGEIYRYMGDAKREELLRVPVFSYGSPRYWRVEILNGNDAPLSDVQLSASMTPKLILFRPAAEHSYRLIYGDEKAQSPSYDLQRTLRISASEEAFAGQLGPEQENAGYQDPRPFSERHPAVLWGSLALAVVLLAYTALRTLRTPPPQPS